MIQKRIDVTHFIHAIQILFLGTFLIAISNFLSMFSTFELYGFIFDLTEVTDLIGYLGQLIVYFFPLILLIMYVKNKHKDGLAVLISIISYAIILFVTMVLGQRNALPSYSYIPYFSITTASGVKYMYQLGLIGTYITAKLVDFVQENFRRKGVGFFAFLDKETYPVIIAGSLSILVGILVTYLWPFAVTAVDFMMDVIAGSVNIGVITGNINSPFNMFLYTVIERMLGLLGLRELFSTSFLFDIVGGSYLSANGNKVLGDVMIWTSQYLDGNLTPLTGKFAVINYPINLVVMPAVITALYSMTTDKKEKMKFLFVYLMALFTLMMAGNVWFAELILVILAPSLFVFYVISSGLISGFLLANSAVIGVKNMENRIVWKMGVIDEFLRYWGDLRMSDKAYMILAVGLALAIVLFILLRYYLKNASFSMRKHNHLPFELERLVESLGGVENIVNINSTVAKVSVELNDRHNVKIEQLKELGASGIVESKKSIVLVFGTLSPYIAKELAKFVKLAK